MREIRTSGSMSGDWQRGPINGLPRQSSTLLHDISLRKQCCIVGGGPAGMMLGFLLARAGVEVAVLEKHADFLRDFRGDTVHPSTLELIYELGLLEPFLTLTHQKVERLSVQIGDSHVRMVDLTHLPTHCKFIALMPQWDLLGFLAKQARRYRTFELHLCAEATDLLVESERVLGVRAKTSEGELTVHADLVVGCDGRHSTVRSRAGLQGEDYGAPMDVLWFRISRKPSDAAETFGHVEAGALLIMLNRGDYWQCAYVIPKGSFERIRTAGIEAFRGSVVALTPSLADRVGELGSFEDIKLLSVRVDRLRKWWRPGLLLIGDAAHAMSPIGGVGINLAVQDAVAAANRLAAPLRSGRVTTEDLQAVQQRRAWPVRATQRLQLIMQDRIVSPALRAQRNPKLPLLFRLLDAVPRLQRVPARLLGMGFRPEHVRTPELPAALSDAPPGRNTA
jgi:2-polyprenyl-6-methoxyphenol hydroxylase-like FAD-dependent oxidoreductase